MFFPFSFGWGGVIAAGGRLSLSCSELELLFAGIHGPVAWRLLLLQSMGRVAAACGLSSCDAALAAPQHVGSSQARAEPLSPTQADSQPQTTREAPVPHGSSEAQICHDKKLDHNGTGNSMEGDLKLQKEAEGQTSSSS